jgi:hypothetical protein
VAYESLIEDIDIVQGDSSAIWFIGLPDGRQLDGGDWTGRYVIAEQHGATPVIDNVLALNSGIGEGDSYAIGTKFVFQILPADSVLLTGGVKYVVAVEITNSTINYNGEIARFKANVLVGN